MLCTMFVFAALIGDIVDSLGSSYMASDQNLPEWVAYRKVLDDSKVTEKLQWLDIRGNHGKLLRNT